MKLAEKIIVITGAGSGIGKEALAHRFKAEGAKEIVAVTNTKAQPVPPRRSLVASP
jgi:NAD(P)-dependent dehydrogenase (short-subunit alcohol dehydrogenase family)